MKQMENIRKKLQEVMQEHARMHALLRNIEDMIRSTADGDATVVVAPLVGVAFRPSEARRMVAHMGTPTEVELVAEPTNPYDPNAIQVLCDGTHIGYIARDRTADIFRLGLEGAAARVTEGTGLKDRIIEVSKK